MIVTPSFLQAGAQLSEPLKTIEIELVLTVNPQCIGIESDPIQTKD